MILNLIPEANSSWTLSIMRNLLTVLLTFASFSLHAMNNTSSINSGIIGAILLLIWFIATVITLFIFLRKFIISKSRIFAFLVYASFASLTTIYALVFLTFYKHQGSLISDDSVVNNIYKDKAITQFWTFTVIGLVLFVSIVSFITFQLKSQRGSTEDRPSNSLE